MSGGCLLLLVLCGIFIYFAAGKFIGSAMKDSMQVAMDMATLREQIMQYKKDTGKYPDKLEDLVPKYVRSASNLRLSTHPNGPPYTYRKPGANAQPDDVLLEYTLTVDMRDGQKVEVPVRMQINGRTRQGGSRVYRGSEGPSGVPNRQPATSNGG